jgi:pyruvate/2-oxoglutarate dehydrogenase complex dihydrolipoamide dehydrogenase (E3) component
MTIEADICVIGAGAGGLSVAAGASMLGARTVLVEKGLMGGDCLNYGCVPSKALLAAGHAAEAVRGAPAFGVVAGPPRIDAARVHAHVRDTIAAIAPNDSVARFEGLGATVIQAPARFVGRRLIEAGETRIEARRVVIATGSVPMIPPIDGLDAVPYLTNETIFGLDPLPRHLIIVGGGPIGVEMAQAHRHLGAEVTILEMASLMPKDDEELVAVVRARLIADGVAVEEGCRVIRVEAAAEGVAVVVGGDGSERRIEGSHLLLATGRRPNVDGLDLETGGIAYTPAGISVDGRLRTSDKKVFALGDVIGDLQFTHMAGYHAGIVIRNALFRLPAKVKRGAVPWVTYTAPELAQVGLTEAAARAQGLDFRVLRWAFAENDRAQAENLTDGSVKAIVTGKGKILGAGIVGAHAGDLIQSWVLAIDQGIKIGALASMIAPYPTLGEVSKRAAGSFYTPTVFGERSKKVVRFLSRFG